MPDYRTSIKESFSSSDLKPRVFSDKAFNGSDYNLKIEVPVGKDENELFANQTTLLVLNGSHISHLLSKNKLLLYLAFCNALFEKDFTNME